MRGVASLMMSSTITLWFASSMVTPRLLAGSMTGAPLASRSMTSRRSWVPKLKTSPLRSMASVVVVVPPWNSSSVAASVTSSTTSTSFVTALVTTLHSSLMGHGAHSHTVSSTNSVTSLITVTSLVMTVSAMLSVLRSSTMRVSA